MNRLDTLLKLSLYQYLSIREIDFSASKDKVSFLSSSIKNVSVFYNRIIFDIINNFSINMETIISLIDDKISLSEIEIICSNIQEILPENFKLSLFKEINDNKKEIYSILIKCNCTLVSGQYISDDFWTSLLRQNILISSNIFHFLYFDFINSKYINNLEKDRNDLEDFKLFLRDSLKNYSKSFIDKENIKKNKNLLLENKTSYEDKIKNMSKEELSIELDNELDLFKITKNDENLKIIAKYYDK